MRAAWVLFLIGCGFQSRSTERPGAGSDASVPSDGDGDGDADLSPICASIALGTPLFQAMACATPREAVVRISDSTSINTDTGASTPDHGLTCVRTSNGNPSPGNQEVCVVVAGQIVIPAGVVVSAQG